jgi:hypothetical protein
MIKLHLYIIFTGIFLWAFIELEIFLFKKSKHNIDDVIKEYQALKKERELLEKIVKDLAK